MKKLLFATLFAVVTSSSFAADEVKIADDSKNISYSVLNQFGIQFSEAKNTVWTLTTQFQKAAFTLDGEKMTAFYSSAGEYLGATKFVKVEQIPAKAQADLSKKYGNYALSYAIQVVDRPYSSVADDSGSFYIDLVGESKELYLKVSTFGTLELIKEIPVK